jgi:hypothetical protein
VSESFSLVYEDVESQIQVFHLVFQFHALVAERHIRVFKVKSGGVECLIRMGVAVWFGGCHCSLLVPMSPSHLSVATYTWPGTQSFYRLRLILSALLAPLKTLAEPSVLVLF